MSIPSDRARALRQSGVSLIELVIFIVIVSVAVAGVLQMLSLSTRLSADPLRRKQALMLAESLLEEVELARMTYCDPADANAATATGAGTASGQCATTPEVPGFEANNSRPYDNVSDYIGPAGQVQLGVAYAAFNNGNGQLVDAGGNTYGLSGYSATLMLSALDAAGGHALGPGGTAITSDATPANMNALKITVAVTYGANADDKVVLDGYRTRYAPNAIP